MAKDKDNEENLNSSTGIENLDEILGGGFPRGSVILLSGSSGSGKTVFSFQWLFEGIKNNENGLYITLTESPKDSLKNLRTMRFYDENAIKKEKLKISDIRNILYDKEYFNQKKIFDFIENEIKRVNAKRLCIDSITAICYNIEDKAKIRNFIFELGKLLSSLGCTAIITSEVSSPNAFSIYGVEEFISHAIIRLDQIKIRGEARRVMQIIKVRGRDYSGNDIYFRISENGIIIFPKINISLTNSSTRNRISTGNADLDRIISGGVFIGSSTVLSGSTGTGKSLFSINFIMEGLKKEEPCLYVCFEESKEQLLRNSESFGWEFGSYEKNGILTLRCTYAGENLVDEHLAEIRKIVENKKIRRCVIDSLSAISTNFQNEDYLNFAIRLNAYLKSQSVTTFFTAAIPLMIGSTGVVSGDHISTMIDNIVMLRHVEVEGSLKFILNIVKTRASSHSKDLIEYRITEKGIKIGRSLAGYEGILTGVTRKILGTVNEEDLFKSKLINAED